jgi:predicted RNA polymerase sigma factor
MFPARRGVRHPAKILLRFNRGLAALARAEELGGAQAGLDLVDQLVAEPALRGYHLLSSVRGDLLMKLGRAAKARAEFERASELTRNGPERQLTAERARCAEAESREATRLR